MCMHKYLLQRSPKERSLSLDRFKSKEQETSETNKAINLAWKVFLLEWTPEKGWHRQEGGKKERYWRWRQELNFLEDIKFSMVSVTSGDVVLIWSCKRFLIIWFDSREHAVNNTTFLLLWELKKRTHHTAGWWSETFPCVKNQLCLQRLSPEPPQLKDS